MTTTRRGDLCEGRWWLWWWVEKASPRAERDARQAADSASGMARKAILAAATRSLLMSAGVSYPASPFGAAPPIMHRVHFRAAHTGAQYFANLTGISGRREFQRAQRVRSPKSYRRDAGTRLAREIRQQWHTSCVLQERKTGNSDEEIVWDAFCCCLRGNAFWQGGASVRGEQ
jgi:hypothetical protein